MATVPLGLSSSPCSTSSIINNNHHQRHLSNSLAASFNPLSLALKSSRSRDSLKSGVCKPSRAAVELFPSVCPPIVVREARLVDCWGVAETHCSSFFPGYTFPWDWALRADRIIAWFSGFTVPNGCRRICLVAVVGSFNKAYVAGILTVDTVADFLPRKGPLKHRRAGIAYVSNVAVRENDRRKGIAKKLVMKAEAQARNWGCRSIALHCDASNPAATRLYKSQGFKCIKVSEKANWPQPKTSPDIQFNFMMKLLNPSSTK